MRYLSIVFLTLFIFTGCGTESVIVRPAETGFDKAAKQESITLISDESLVLKTSGGSEIEIYDFAEPSLITSPLKLEGMVPANWIFEGEFGVTLSTNTGELIKRWYGTAKTEKSGDNPLEFFLELDFDVPENGEEIGFGILTLERARAKDNDKRDFVEVKVLFK